MRLYLVSSIARNLRSMRQFHSEILKCVPRKTCLSAVRPTIALSLCCAYIGFESHRAIPIGLSRAVCQEAVVIEEESTHSDIQTLKSFNLLLIEQLKLWHHFLRNMASSAVQTVLISIRLTRNSLLFGPLFFAYPLVYLFPDTFRDLWLSGLLRAVELSGPTFIKLGQWASTRRDLFGQEFCDRLSQLHRNAPSHSLEYTEWALEHAFGVMWKKIFRLETTDSNAEACTMHSGCVGQVHKAYMRPDIYEVIMDGNSRGLQSCVNTPPEPHQRQGWIPVAIKVLHPGIQENVDLDLKIIHLFARLLHFIPGLHWIGPVELVQEFESLMKNQINLRLEGENLQKFYQNFSTVPHVRVPRPIWPFVTSEVLVETYEKGESISAFILSPEDSPEDVRIKKQLAQMGIDVILKMVFVDNLVHADLHPGNILVQGTSESLSQAKRRVRIVDHITELQVCLEDSPSPLKLVLLDTGITAHLEQRDFENFHQVFTAIVQCKGDVVAKLFVQHATSNDCKDLDKFKSDMGQLVARVHEQTPQLGKMQVGMLLRDLFALMIHHKVKLESNFASTILAIMVLEGLGRSLDPQLDILEAARPILLGR